MKSYPCRVSCDPDGIVKVLSIQTNRYITFWIGQENIVGELFETIKKHVFPTKRLV